MGYGSLLPMRNGLAIAGDYISAATVLGTGGVIALAGYDGVVLALSTALLLMLLMFLLAEPLRNAGRFTMGDGVHDGCRARGTHHGVRRDPRRPAAADAGRCCAGHLLAFILGFSSGSQTGCITGLAHHDQLRGDRRHEGHRPHPDPEDR